MTLDLSSLGNAVERLREGLARHQREPGDEQVMLREAFDDSDLPCKVDLVDWQELGERFRELIAAARVAL